jgi:hypothetical protein
MIKMTLELVVMILFTAAAFTIGRKVGRNQAVREAKRLAGFPALGEEAKKAHPGSRP